MIRRLPADKYNIAWFKLAEFVIRGEKERALALYRLLVHSLHDEALAYQLEGDLLLAFGDPKALEVYGKAARAFQEKNRSAQAAAVYEHIISLKPEDIGVLKILVELYRIINHHQKVCMFSCMLIKKYVDDNRIVEVDALLAELSNYLDEILIAKLYEQVIITYLSLPRNKQLLAEQYVLQYLENALTYYSCGKDTHHLHQFLVKLEMVSESYKTKALSFLKQ